MFQPSTALFHDTHCVSCSEHIPQFAKCYSDPFGIIGQKILCPACYFNTRDIIEEAPPKSEPQHWMTPDEMHALVKAAAQFDAISARAEEQKCKARTESTRSLYNGSVIQYEQWRDDALRQLQDGISALLKR